MGNTLFSTDNHHNDHLTTTLKDIRYLGEHYPFSDTELKILYNVYNNLLLYHNNANATSFLYDIIYQCEYCTNHPPNQMLMSSSSSSFITKKNRTRGGGNSRRRRQRRHSKASNDGATDIHDDLHNNSACGSFTVEEKEMAQKELERRWRIIRAEQIQNYVRIVEETILPPHFSQRFQSNLFLPTQTQTTTTTTNPTQTTSETNVSSSTSTIIERGMNVSSVHTISDPMMTTTSTEERDPASYHRPSLDRMKMASIRIREQYQDLYRASRDSVMSCTSVDTTILHHDPTISDRSGGVIGSNLLPDDCHNNKNNNADTDETTIQSNKNHSSIFHENNVLKHSIFGVMTSVIESVTTGGHASAATEKVNNNTRTLSSTTLNNDEDTAHANNNHHNNGTAAAVVDGMDFQDCHQEHQQAQPPLMDEYTRKVYLYSFFRGLAVSSRRGCRAAVKAMFLVCEEVIPTSSFQQQPTGTKESSQQQQQQQSEPDPLHQEGYPHPINGTTTNEIDDISTRRIRATELIDMGYRLALATSYLRQVQENDVIIQQQLHSSSYSEDITTLDSPNKNDSDAMDDTTTTTTSATADPNHEKVDESNHVADTTNEEDNENHLLSSLPDPHRFIPPPSSSLHPVLQSFANSLLERARVRYQRSTNGGYGKTTPNADTIDKEDGTVLLEDVHDWVENVAPLFGSILPTFMSTILFPPQFSLMSHALPDRSTNNLNSQRNVSSSSNQRSTFHMPSVPMSSSVFLNSDSSPLLFTFGCLSPSLSSGTPYHRLYTSAADGLSFNRLQNSILGYSGPTLFIIRAVPPPSTTTAKSSTSTTTDASTITGPKKVTESIFGAYTSSSWKEMKDFYGNTDCFLYQLAPCTAVYRPTGNGQNYMYCNSTARSRGYDQQAHGIGFGGTVDQPRLFIEESFDHCVAMNRDLTFDNGHILPIGPIGTQPPNTNYHFDIDSLEVWGVGGSDTIAAGLVGRGKQRAVIDESIRRARKVDKAQFLDDFRSGLMDSKAFKHQGEVDGGRADCRDSSRKS